jgi:hypothetical protein
MRTGARSVLFRRLRRRSGSGNRCVILRRRDHHDMIAAAGSHRCGRKQNPSQKSECRSQRKRRTRPVGKCPHRRSGSESSRVQFGNWLNHKSSRVRSGLQEESRTHSGEERLYLPVDRASWRLEPGGLGAHPKWPLPRRALPNTCAATGCDLETCLGKDRLRAVQPEPQLPGGMRSEPGLLPTQVAHALQQSSRHILEATEQFPHGAIELLCQAAEQAAPFD